MQVIKPVVILGLLISSLLANAEDRGRAYVSNQEGGVSIINLNTMETDIMMLKIFSIYLVILKQIYLLIIKLPKI
jgi:hypothetical protein